jgi:hypothetical protein
VQEARAENVLRSWIFSRCRRWTSWQAASSRLARCQLLLVRGLRVQHAHLFARDSQMRRNLFLAAKTVPAGIGFNLGAVQRDAFQRDQALSTQDAQHLREQIVECGLVVGADA